MQTSTHICTQTRNKAETHFLGAFSVLYVEISLNKQEHDNYNLV